MTTEYAFQILGTIIGLGGVGLTVLAIGAHRLSRAAEREAIKKQIGTEAALRRAS